MVSAKDEHQMNNKVIKTKHISESTRTFVIQQVTMDSGIMVIIKTTNLLLKNNTKSDLRFRRACKLKQLDFQTSSNKVDSRLGQIT